MGQITGLYTPFSVSLYIYIYIYITWKKKSKGKLNRRTKNLLSAQCHGHAGHKNSSREIEQRAKDPPTKTTKTEIGYFLKSGSG
jgi:hypothetical protein